METTYILKIGKGGGYSIEPFAGEEGSLRQLQEAVGGFIERVPVDGLEERGFDIWVNEEGLFEEDPVENRRISALARTGVVGDAAIAKHDGAGRTVGLRLTECVAMVMAFEGLDVLRGVAGRMA